MSECINFNEHTNHRRLTIFAVPKPFHGHIGLIQRNAIKSWTLLKPKPEILLLGDEEGIAEIAAEMDLRHEPGIARNEFGTPLVNDVFSRAERLGDTPQFAYVNADIILTSRFTQAVHAICDKFTQFLMVGRRMDVSIVERLDFDNLEWEEKLRQLIRQKGYPYSQYGMDYFVFSRGLWNDIPSFAIGRIAWDGWLFHWPVSRGKVVVDGSNLVEAIHQQHAYAHNRDTAWNGIEAQRNRALIDEELTFNRCDQAPYALDIWGNIVRGREDIPFPNKPLWRDGRFKWFLEQALFFARHDMQDTSQLMIDEARAIQHSHRQEWETDIVEARVRSSAVSLWLRMSMICVWHGLRKGMRIFQPHIMGAKNLARHAVGRARSKIRLRTRIKGAIPRWLSQKLKMGGK